MYFHSNGQWTLDLVKSQLPQESSEGPKLDSLVGREHTVEVHPDMDHLYNAKGFIQESGRPYLHIGDFKRSGQFGHILDKIPRDARGRVSPEMIDKHIEQLPKQKVQIKVAPFAAGVQQHRGGVPQYTLSVGLHPETLQNMSPAHRFIWENVKKKQHSLGGHENQIGWARIDPNRVDTLNNGQKKVEPNRDHWHLDEIQSDFVTPDKLKNRLNDYLHPTRVRWDLMNANDEELSKNPATAEVIPLREQIAELNKYHSEVLNDGDEAEAAAVRQQIHGIRNKINQKLTDAAKKIAQDRQSQFDSHLRQTNGKMMNTMVSVLSHGHEDPQHLVHSAVNQFARQNGIKSTSMDTPNDQAEQSGLQPKAQPQLPAREWENSVMTAREKPLEPLERDQLWESQGKPLADRHMADIDFQSAAKKLGKGGLREWADLRTIDPSSWMLEGASDLWDESLQDYDSPTFYEFVLSPSTRKTLLQMNDREKDAMSRFLRDYDEPVLDHYAQKYGLGKRPPNVVPPKEYDLPIHQINTYTKRPRKLGMKVVPKKNVMGEFAHDEYPDIQYARLYKHLKQLRDLLKNG